MLIEIDPNGWTPHRKVLVEACVCALLGENSITFTSLSVNYNVNPVQIDIGNPSSSPTAIITKTNIGNKYDAIIAANNAAASAEAILEASRVTEYNSNPFKKITFNNIENKISTHRAALNTAKTNMNAASNLAQAKAAGVQICDANIAILNDLEKFIKLIWSKNIT